MLQQCVPPPIHHAKRVFLRAVPIHTHTHPPTPTHPPPLPTRDPQGGLIIHPRPKQECPQFGVVKRSAPTRRAPREHLMFQLEPFGCSLPLPPPCRLRKAAPKWHLLVGRLQRRRDKINCAPHIRIGHHQPAAALVDHVGTVNSLAVRCRDIQHETTALLPFESRNNKLSSWKCLFHPTSSPISCRRPPVHHPSVQVVLAVMVGPGHASRLQEALNENRLTGRKGHYLSNTRPSLDPS